MKVVLAWCAGTIVGVLISGVLTNSIDARPAISQDEIATEMVLAEIAAAKINMLVLTELPRESCGNASKLVKTALSANVAVLDEWKKGVGAHRRDEVDKLLRAIARFRHEHPFETGNPRADEAVVAILDSVSPAGDSNSYTDPSNRTDTWKH